MRRREAGYRRGIAQAATIARSYSWKCHYCGKRATSMDHFVPWSITRDNSDKNLVPACRRCNSIAGAKRFDTVALKKIHILDRLAEKAGLVEVRCPKGCGVTYARKGRRDKCPDCGELL